MEEKCLKIRCWANVPKDIANIHTKASPKSKRQVGADSFPTRADTRMKYSRTHSQSFL